MSVNDRWNGARTGVGKRYEVRWRSGGVQRKRRFDFLREAEKFDAKQKLQPDVRHAREGRSLTVDQMMATWLATKARKRPNTIDACTYDAREVTTTFGGRLVSSLRPSEIRTWTARDRGASVRRRSLAALRQGYKLAVADGLIPTDPTAGIPLPQQPESNRSALSWAELEKLAGEAGDYAPLVWLLGTSGLRIGEALALEVADIGPKRLRVRTSKTGRGRDVPIQGFVRDMLQLDQPGRLFRGQRGAPLNVGWFRRKVFEPAAARAGFGELRQWTDEDGKDHEEYSGPTPHSLRHTAASLAIASGADVKAVQRMLGHRSAAMTMDLYGHLFDEQLDIVADRMSQAREAALRPDVSGGEHDTPVS